MNLFIHRRDFRFNDNTTLLKMYETYDDITPIFIFNPEQIYEKNNKYFSNNLVEFLCTSLIDLKKKYKKNNILLNFFEGNVIEILSDIHKKYKINSIGFNMDYSPFSKKRDKEIINWCKKHSIDCIVEEDMLLHNIKSNNGLNPNTGKPYVVFTPFKKNLYNFEVSNINKKIIKGVKRNIKSTYKILNKDLKKYYTPNKKRNVKGGRNNGLLILNRICDYKNYDKCRNFLTYKTTNLSAYINLGLVSIREVYHTVKNKLGTYNGINNELYWRDFYYNILYHFPHVVGNPFKKKYDKIQWENNKEFLQKWKDGQTGFPVVDACMKQMNTTGYMHNRGRMIVSSFLVKNLWINWRWGEKYFANKLVDYNISANNGGWQWSTGGGTDAQPYFRIFNAWTQAKF